MRLEVASQGGNNNNQPYTQGTETQRTEEGQEEYGMVWRVFNRARRVGRWMAEDKRQKRQRRRESIEVGARQQRKWAADGDDNQRWRHMGTTAAPDEWQWRG